MLNSLFLLLEFMQPSLHQLTQLTLALTLILATSAPASVLTTTLALTCAIATPIHSAAAVTAAVYKSQASVRDLVQRFDKYQGVQALLQNSHEAAVHTNQTKLKGKEIPVLLSLAQLITKAVVACEQHPGIVPFILLYDLMPLCLQQQQDVQ
ncbi:hypothetical protein BDW22DRAFT_1347332 [Trametopsis cervina]|nr:hypothetical protein BDW22DRAFT_1347332 [Trametopsis cervina]